MTWQKYSFCILNILGNLSLPLNLHSSFDKFDWMDRSGCSHGGGAWNEIFFWHFLFYLYFVYFLIFRHIFFSSWSSNILYQDRLFLTLCIFTSTNPKEKFMLICLSILHLPTPIWVEIICLSFYIKRLKWIPKTKIEHA